MNSILVFSIITLIVFLLPVLAGRLGREYLIALLPIYLLVGNVLAESFTEIFGILTSFAIPIYAGTFLITDIISEKFGVKEAKRAVWLGIIAQVFLVIVVALILSSDVVPYKKDVLEAAFGFLPRLVIASSVAYITSQFLDVYIFHWIRERMGTTHRWVRNLVSTVISQFLDTGIFLGIAFYGKPPFEDPSVWLKFVIFTWLFKSAVAMIDTPFFLYATSKRKKI